VSSDERGLVDRGKWPRARASDCDRAGGSIGFWRFIAHWLVAPGLAVSAREVWRALQRCRVEAEGEDRCRASTSFFPRVKTWMAGTRPGHDDALVPTDCPSSPFAARRPLQGSASRVKKACAKNRNS
jgi:hypothetical protein